MIDNGFAILDKFRALGVAVPIDDYLRLACKAEGVGESQACQTYNERAKQTAPRAQAGERLDPTLL